MDHMESNNLFTIHKHGFRKDYYCVTQLIDVCEKWTYEVDTKNNIDTVPHQRLLKKLKGYVIQGKVLCWIESFLKNRKQRVQVYGSSSDWADVSSGIPQGTMLGPTQFLVYINDVVHSLLNFFADDAKIYAIVNTQEEANIVQQDLSRVDNWSGI